MNYSANVILQLLKVALGNSDKVDYDSSKVNWTEVIELATNQGVLGVCFDAFDRLPNEFRPDIDNLMEWLGQTSYMESQYEQYVETIRELALFLEQQNLKVLLMKGYGCSLNYPVPKHRPCGDIDIYILNEKGEHNANLVKFAEEILESKLGVKVTYENSHHSQFQFDSFTVENHSTVLDVDVHKPSVYLNGLLEEAAKESVANVDPVTGVCLPSARFNSIHLLRHMASDFATVKTTLRHVLDWSTFVASPSALPNREGTVDWKFVHEVANKTNMNRFLDAINGICVDYLGYPAEMFPVEHNPSLREPQGKLNSGTYESLELKVLEDILNPEFTDEIPPMSNKLAYGWVKTKRMWKNRWKHRIVFDESLWDSFLSHAKNRLRQE